MSVERAPTSSIWLISHIYKSVKYKALSCHFGTQDIWPMAAKLSKKLYCRLRKRHYLTSFVSIASYTCSQQLYHVILLFVLGLHRLKPSLNLPMGVSMATQPMAWGMVHICHESNTSTGLRHFCESLIETPSSKCPYIVNLNGLDWRKDRRRCEAQTQWNSLFSEKVEKTQVYVIFISFSVPNIFDLSFK